MNRTIFTLIASMVVVGALVAPAAADSLENLERERAYLVALLMDAGMAPAERQLKLEAIARRLRDLERIALRDDSLATRATPTVRTALENYDLTFLLHAAAEKGVWLPEHWLAMMGVSTDSLLATRDGRS